MVRASMGITAQTLVDGHPGRDGEKLSIPSPQGLAPNGSKGGSATSLQLAGFRAAKLVDAKAKPWHDDRVSVVHFVRTPI